MRGAGGRAQPRAGWALCVRARPRINSIHPEQGGGCCCCSIAGYLSRETTHRSAWCFAFLVLGYLLYLVFGAVVFSSVELPYEDLLRQELRKLKRRFLEEHECLSEQPAEQFLRRVLEASNYGVSVLGNASGNWNWDFTSALFFASTVLSTTGPRIPALAPLHSHPICPRGPLHPLVLLSTLVEGARNPREKNPS
ncbi:Potassium channel subfamily K member 1 [Chelonia mydas]|uniref:Potassium channel subfamily K member 1 n=1 Tax=Chelonia mydas TaxID=8469 RepID=M7BGB4_CHEMY|nr:Potassium channel subfamily K member 1 [Chelonia mydas]